MHPHTGDSWLTAFRRWCLLALGAALVVSAAAAAQGPTAGSSDVYLIALRDSTKVERSALDALRKYTRAFRRMVPVPGLGGSPPPWGPEYLLSPKARAGAGTAMMTSLRTSAANSPGDTWITDVLVEQYVRMGSVAMARAAVEQCRAERWWCEMLQMYVMHRTQPLVPADSLLDDALARMPADTRCAWGDVSLLFSADYIVDRREQQRYEQMDCAERALVEERLWWLADPMYSIPGNERRTEHFAREVRLRLDYEWNLANMCNYTLALRGLRGAAVSFHAVAFTSRATAGASLDPVEEPEAPRTFSQAAWNVFQQLQYSDAYGGAVNATAKGIMPGSLVRGSIWEDLNWPDRRSCPNTAQHPVVGIRLGPPTMSVGAAATAVGVGGQFMASDQNRVSFVPHPHAIESPFDAVEDDWEPVRDLPRWLQPEDMPETGVSRVGPMLPIEWQTGYFLRGDSARLVVATDVRTRPELANRFLSAALALSTSPNREPLVFRQPNGGPRFVFDAMVPTDSAILSLEIESVRSAAGRVRAAAGPPPRTGQPLAVSDAVLYMPDDPDPARSLDDVVQRIYPVARFAEGRAIGVFWEEYGLAAAEMPTLSVSLVRDDSPGVLSRLLGRAPAAPPIQTIVLEGAGQGTALDPRHLTIDLAGVDPGRYRLELSVTVTGQAPVQMQRRLEVCEAKRPDCL